MLIGKFIANARRRGIAATLARISCAVVARAGVARRMKKFLDYIFDKRYGTKTSGIIHLENLSIDSRRKEFGTHYVATPRYEFKRLISRLGIDPKKYIFVDFGCGMGRVLLYAVNYNFRGVVGIEFSDYLAGIAQENLSKYAGRYGGTAQVIAGDAEEFPIPGAPCVLFFFNPFTDTVAREVASNIYTAYKAGNRAIYVIWYNVTPNAKAFFDAPWLEVVAGDRTYRVSDDKTPPILQMMEISFPYSIFKVCDE